MSRRIAVSGVFAFVLSLVNIFPAAAQPFRRGNQNMAPPKAVSLKGTLVSASANQLQITVDSKPVYVAIGQDTEVSITGMAEPEYLKSGMGVEFVAEVAKGGVVSEKLDHLTLVTISSTDRPSGLLPPSEGASKKKGDKDDKAQPPAAAGGDAPDATSGKKSKSHGGTPQLPGTYTVRGTLRMARNGKISLAVAHGPLVKAELAEGATIDVDLTDVRIAQRDDAVTVKGNQVRPGMIAANSVTIALAAPLTGKKHAKAPSTRSKAKDADAAAGK